MNLKDTLFNIKLSKNNFFNIKVKSYVNSDILKNDVIYFWKKEMTYRYVHNKTYERVGSNNKSIRNVIISPPNSRGWNLYFFAGNQVNDSCMDWYLYL